MQPCELGRTWPESPLITGEVDKSNRRLDHSSKQGSLEVLWRRSRFGSRVQRFLAVAATCLAQHSFEFNSRMLAAICLIWAAECVLAFLAYGIN